MATEMTVWERQRDQLKWQLQQHQSYLNNNTNSNVYSPSQPSPLSQSPNLLPTFSLPSKFSSDGWPDLGHYSMLGNSSLNQVNCLPRTSSCPPEVQEEKREKAKSVLKKRKADAVHIPKQETDTLATEDKRMKGDADLQLKEESNNNNGKRSEKSATTTKENSKLSEGSKSDYIHVRARRGQATDNHSLAERVRREKISERMTYLQDLVPGCNKITGKAGMLDEIINYVQSLQKQVEFLSMKLAAVNPRIELNIDNFLDKEIIPVCNGSVSAFEISSEFAEQSYIPYEQLVACCGLDLSMSSPEKSCFNVHQPSPVWDTDLHSICNVEFNPAGRASSFSFQSLQGTVEDNDFKAAM